MAKDPAVLWYWSDWFGGTMTLSRHLKGCYMDLLYAQFNSGPLSLEEIKTVLGADFSAWNTLAKKFHQTETGLFFNERMEAEKLKRAEFSKKQSFNGKKGGRPPSNKPKQNPTLNPNESLLENENENVDEDCIYSEERTRELFFNDSKVYEEVVKNRGFSDEQYRFAQNEFWSDQKLAGTVTTRPYADLRMHFSRWCRTQEKRIKQKSPVEQSTGKVETILSVNEQVKVRFRGAGNKTE